MMIELRQVREMPELMQWRYEVIENVFGQEPDSALMASNRAYYEWHIEDETHLAFIAVKDGEECGCCSICLSEELPSPDNFSGKCAYLMNIYVREPYRNHGIGHQMVARLLEEAKKRNCGKIYLETTEDGKPVYTSMGFRDMPDMMKYYA